MSQARKLIDEYLREGRLSANRSQPIGAGSYGVVYQSDVPGNVIKQSTQYGQDLEKEANLQAIAADLGIAPQVRGLETFRGGVGDRIEMQDIRDNYTVGTSPTARQSVQQAQQIGELALRGVRLEDRRDANIAYNKTTGRPLQLDFGIAGKMDKAQSAAYISQATAEGMEAAGLGDFGSILRATVMDYLEGGDVDEAMDLAKQGFSRLQKIKAPLAEAVSLY